MNFVVNSTIIIALASVLLGYAIHSPIPDDVPERTLPQVATNLISFLGLLVSCLAHVFLLHLFIFVYVGC